MVRKINVIGFDPSLTHWGVAKAQVDIDTLEYDVTDLVLVETESESKKMNVRKQSDNLRRAREIWTNINEICADGAIAITEVPLCNAAMSAYSNERSGIIVGILGAFPIPLIEVFPKDVKKLATGSANADKVEMIEWAMGRFPNAPWLMRTLKGKSVPKRDNEHLADAVAVINAGLQTAEFRQAISMMRAMSAPSRTSPSYM